MEALCASSLLLAASVEAPASLLPRYLCRTFLTALSVRPFAARPARGSYSVKRRRKPLLPEILWHSLQSSQSFKGWPSNAHTAVMVWSRSGGGRGDVRTSMSAARDKALIFTRAATIDRSVSVNDEEEEEAAKELGVAAMVNPVKSSAPQWPV